VEFCCYLLNVVLISRRDSISSNARIGTWQVNCEASSGRHCLSVDRAALRVRCGESSLITRCRRIRFTVDRCCSRWDVTLCIKVFSIWVGLSNECCCSASRTGYRKVFFRMFSLCLFHILGCWFVTYGILVV
jgi:hypothetical protein